MCCERTVVRTQLRQLHAEVARISSITAHSTHNRTSCGSGSFSSPALPAGASGDDTAAQDSNSSVSSMGAMQAKQGASGNNTTAEDSSSSGVSSSSKGAVQAKQGASSNVTTAQDGSSSSVSSSMGAVQAKQAALEQRVEQYGKVLQAMRNRIVALQVCVCVRASVRQCVCQCCSVLL